MLEKIKKWIYRKGEYRRIMFDGIKHPHSKVETPSLRDLQKLSQWQFEEIIRCLMENRERWERYDDL